MTPDLIAAAMEATWPPAATWQVGPWVLRDGKGGGKRVSAATLGGSFAVADIEAAESAMQAKGQRPLFQLRPCDAALDAALEARRYNVVDPVQIYAAALGDLPPDPPPVMTTFPHWPPLGIAVDLWLEGGIDQARLDVMYRAAGAKAVILARTKDRAAGVAFVAMHGATAILHALEVTPPVRRTGVALNIMQAAVQWTKDQGGNDLGLAVTTANAPARALYASFGMRVVGHYHYRQL